MMGVNQGCKLSGDLFITFLKTVMRLAKSGFDGGITIDGQKISRFEVY